MKSYTWDLNKQLSSDEITKFTQLLYPRKIQFIESPDNDAELDEATFSDLLTDSFHTQDKEMPIFMPFVINGHDVLLALIPTGDGKLQAYFADSLGFSEVSKSRGLAKKAIDAINNYYPDIIAEDIIDISVHQQTKQNCGLTVIDNILTILNCYDNHKEIYLTELPTAKAKLEYFQNLGNRILEKEDSRETRTIEDLEYVLKRANPNKTLKLPKDIVLQLTKDPSITADFLYVKVIDLINAISSAKLKGSDKVSISKSVLMDLAKQLSDDDLTSAKPAKPLPKKIPDDVILWNTAKEILLNLGMSPDAAQRLIGGPRPNPRIFDNTSTDTALHGIKILAQAVLKNTKKGSKDKKHLNKVVENTFGQIGAILKSSSVIYKDYSEESYLFREAAIDEAKRTANRLIPTNNAQWNNLVLQALEFEGRGTIRNMGRAATNISLGIFDFLNPFSSVRNERGFTSFNSQDYSGDMGMLFLVMFCTMGLAPAAMPVVAAMFVLRTVCAALQIAKDVYELTSPVIKAVLLFECVFWEAALEVIKTPYRVFQHYKGHEQLPFLPFSTALKNYLFDTTPYTEHKPVELSKAVKDIINRNLGGDTTTHIRTPPTTPISTSIGVDRGALRPDSTPSLGTTTSLGISI